MDVFKCCCPSPLSLITVRRRLQHVVDCDSPKGSRILTVKARNVSYRVTMQSMPKVRNVAVFEDTPE